MSKSSKWDHVVRYLLTHVPEYTCNMGHIPLYRTEDKTMLTTVHLNPFSHNIKIEHDPTIKSNREDERPFHRAYQIVKERDKEKWQMGASPTDQTSGKPVYRVLSCERIGLTRSALEVVCVTVAKDAINGSGKVPGSFGS